MKTFAMALIAIGLLVGCKSSPPHESNERIWLRSEQLAVCERMASDKASSWDFFALDKSRENIIEIKDWRSGRIAVHVPVLQSNLAGYVSFTFTNSTHYDGPADLYSFSKFPAGSVKLDLPVAALTDPNSVRRVGESPDQKSAQQVSNGGVWLRSSQLMACEQKAVEEESSSNKAAREAGINLPSLDAQRQNIIEIEDWRSTQITVQVPVTFSNVAGYNAVMFTNSIRFAGPANILAFSMHDTGVVRMVEIPLDEIKDLDKVPRRRPPDQKISK